MTTKAKVNASMNPQQAMRAKLESIGLPYREVRVYGSQIVVTVASEDTGRKWANLLATFAKLRGMVRSVDYVKVNRGTCLNPTVMDVWRVYACIRESA